MTNNIFVNFDKVGLNIKDLIAEKRLFTKKEKKINMDLINNLTFTAKNGDKIGILGENGSGKSTLLRLIAGIYKPTSGNLKIKGECVGYFGDVFLNDYITGKEYIYTTLRLNGLSVNQIDSLYPKILDFISLNDYLDNNIVTYSEGMKARVSLCSVLFSKPDILLIDEGIGAGDRFFVDKAKIAIDEKLKNSPILFIASHSEALIQNFCHKVIILAQGKMVFEGNINDGINYYKSEEFKNKYVIKKKL